MRCCGGGMAVWSLIGVIVFLAGVGLIAALVRHLRPETLADGSADPLNMPEQRGDRVETGDDVVGSLTGPLGDKNKGISGSNDI